MPRTISQKRCAIRKRVSYMFWVEVYDQLRGMEPAISKEQISEIMKMMFYQLDYNTMFNYYQRAVYHIQSMKQVLEDFKCPTGEPPKGWKWPELTDNIAKPIDADPDQQENDTNDSG